MPSARTRARIGAPGSTAESGWLTSAGSSRRASSTASSGSAAASAERGEGLAAASTAMDDVVVAGAGSDRRVGERRLGPLPDELVSPAGHDRAPDLVAGRALDLVPADLDRAAAARRGHASGGVGAGQVGPGLRHEDGDALCRDRHGDRGVAHRQRALTEGVGEDRAGREHARERHVDRPLLLAEVEDDHRRLLVRPANVRQRPRCIVGVDEPKVPRAQRLVLAAQPTERPVPVAQVRVDGIPGVGPAVVGVVVAGEPGLGAVVDRGHPGPGELDRGDESQLRLRRCEALRRLLHGRVVLARRERPQDPRRVVAVDEVQQGVPGGLRIVLHDALHAGGELGGSQADDRAVEVGGVAVDEPDDGAPEAVVHGRVGLVAEEPGRAVEPLLAEDERVGVGGLRRLADLPHETVAHVVHDVEPPARRPGLDPAPDDAVGADEEVVRRGLLDELGDRVEAEPARRSRCRRRRGGRGAGRWLVRGRGAEREPGAVGRLGRLAGADPPRSGAHGRTRASRTRRG